MRLPWISREHHEALMLERERLVVELRAEVARLEKRLSDPVQVTVKLPDDFAVQMPAVLRRRSKESVKPENSLPQEEQNWHELDETDPRVLAKVVAQETGGRRLQPIELAQFVARIKRRIVQAKTNRTIRQLEMGTLDSRIPPTAHVENPEDNIPEEIRQRIEAAERV